MYHFLEFSCFIGKKFIDFLNLAVLGASVTNPKIVPLA